jgi:hypothetical protein
MWSLFGLTHFLFHSAALFHAGNATSFENITLSDFAVTSHVLHLHLLLHFALLSGLTLFGAPAGCPSDFFSEIRERFSDAVISPAVFGVFSLTRLLGLQ